MFFNNKKKLPHDTCCMACHAVVAIMLFAASLASLLGLVAAHIDVELGMPVFGTVSGSLALLAFGVSLTLWMHAMRAWMTDCEACGTKK